MCLEAKMIDDSERGERVCTQCGYVQTQTENVVTTLPFDQTFALENPLVINKSLGSSDTLRNYYGYSRVLASTRNNDAKT